MAKATIFRFVLFVVLFVSPVFAANEVTGKQLPDEVKSAIKAANKTSFTWESKNDQTAINQDQIVLIKNMSEFCKIRSIIPTDCSKFGLAFVIDQAYPIYLNADYKNTPSNYDQVERMYYGGVSNIVYFLAGILVHEDYHAQGNSDEYGAYQRELAFMMTVKESGGVNNAIWFPGYLDSIKANITAYNEKRNDGFTVKSVVAKASN